MKKKHPKRRTSVDLTPEAKRLAKSWAAYHAIPLKEFVSDIIIAYGEGKLKKPI